MNIKHRNRLTEHTFFQNIFQKNTDVCSFYYLVVKHRHCYQCYNATNAVFLILRQNTSDHTTWSPFVPGEKYEKLVKYHHQNYTVQLHQSHTCCSCLVVKPVNPENRFHPPDTHTGTLCIVYTIHYTMYSIHPPSGHTHHRY